MTEQRECSTTFMFDSKRSSVIDTARIREVIEKRGYVCMLVDDDALSMTFFTESSASVETFEKMSVDDFSNEEEVADYIIRSIKKYCMFRLRRPARFSILIKKTIDTNNILHVCIGEGKWLGSCTGPSG